MASESLTTTGANAPGMGISMGDGAENTVSKEGSTEEAIVMTEEEAEGTEGMVKLEEPEDEDLLEDGEEEGSDEAAQGDDDDEEEGEEEGDELTVLEAFDADDLANVEAWDEEYLQEDGQLDRARFDKEIAANVAAGGEYDLNEATYDYLESKGYPKDLAKDFVAKLANESQGDTGGSDDDMALFTHAGGPDALQEALSWGGAGGYEKKALASFNKVMKGKDAQAKLDAVDVLMARYNRSDAGKASKAAADELAKKKAKPVKPKRDATKGAGKRRVSAPKPFANLTEFTEARKAAGANQKKNREVAERMAVSSF